ncbi:MAG: hypothetical protein ACO3EP_11125 [Phycisphaerales bacterium]|jgi:hypothetical protein
MSLGSKMTSLQAYNMLIYRRALHPEFFGIDGRRRLVHGDFEFEAWIFRGGHALRMQHEGNCVCELVTDQLEHLPEKGLATTLPCAGERDHEERIGEDVTFMTSIQTETLSDHLYVGTYRELLDHARSANSLLVQWNDEQGKGNLSILDMQRFRDEVHMQGYHMRSDCGLVLRTQSMFQLAADPVAGV